jgi:hypothetical protein
VLSNLCYTLRMKSLNSKEVKSTLKLVLSILEKHKVNYRVIGSVCTAAIIGHQHRKLGDIDLIIDSSKKREVLEELYEEGFYHRGGMFAFARKYLDLDSLEHDEYLEVGMFWGTWENDDFIIGSRSNGITIDKKALVKLNCVLHGENFIGIPKEVVARGLRMSSGNPKRKVAIKFFDKNDIRPMANDYIHTNILGLNIDFVYYVAMQLLNIIGFVRVKLNKPFDPWR